MNEETMSEPQQSPNLLWHRIKLVALISVFLLPFIAGWLAFYVFEYDLGSKNYGTLVQPVRPMSLPPLTDIKGESLDAGFWRKWTFVVLDKQGCGEACQQNLYYLRQLRTALGRDSDRLQNVLILSAAPGDSLMEFLDDYPLLKVITADNPEVFNDFALPGIDPGAEPVLYLIDPLGNLMMSYPAQHDWSAVLSDMRRLLKVSQVG